MPSFKQTCSCYMFASTGYSEGDAGTVQLTFQNYAEDVGPKILKKLNDEGLDEKVEHLVNHMRLFAGVDDAATDVVVYGCYTNKKDATPTHMWIRVGKVLYDTMPDAPLRKSKDGAKDNQPPSVDGDEPAGNIGKFACKMTAWQAANIADKKIY